MLDAGRRRLPGRYRTPRVRVGAAAARKRPPARGRLYNSVAPAPNPKGTTG
jgi:hypothetical protein